MLTGDNLLVAKRVCEELAIPSSMCVVGSQLALLEDDDFIAVVEQASIFAKVKIIHPGPQDGFLNP